MKIIGLSASPRLHGNTETLLDSFLDGAAEVGAEVEKVYLADLELQPCIGCELCYMEGVCQFNDDVPELQARMLDADVVVLSTPVYFYSVSSHAKLLIDRSQCLWARRSVLRQQVGKLGGRGVLLCAGASKGWKLFDGIILTVRYFMDTLGKDLAGCLTYRQMSEKRSIMRHPSALVDARELGRKIATDANYRQEEKYNG